MTIHCPKCGFGNEHGGSNCLNCHVNLQWALDNPDHWAKEAEREAERALIRRGRPLEISLSLPQPLLWPPSVAQFSESAGRLKRQTLADATAIVRAALVGLLARRFVQVLHHSRYIALGPQESKPHQGVLYVLRTGDQLGTTSIDGYLETRLLAAVAAWPTSRAVDVREWAQGLPLDQADGLPIYQAAWAVFDKNEYSPVAWIYHLVGTDAIQRGCGRLDGWTLQLNPIHDNSLQTEHALMTELSSSLGQQQPGFSQVIDEQVKRAIRSRTATYDWYP